MIPINNSDTAWLIVADYNQDNGKYHEELIEDVLNPETNQWSWTGNNADNGVGDSGSGIGGVVGDVNRLMAGGVTGDVSRAVGDVSRAVGGKTGIGKLVGGRVYIRRQS